MHICKVASENKIHEEGKATLIIIAVLNLDNPKTNTNKYNNVKTIVKRKGLINFYYK